MYLVRCVPVWCSLLCLYMYRCCICFSVLSTIYISLYIHLRVRICSVVPCMCVSVCCAACANVACTPSSSYANKCTHTHTHTRMRRPYDVKYVINTSTKHPLAHFFLYFVSFAFFFFDFLFVVCSAFFLRYRLRVRVCLYATLVHISNDIESKEETKIETYYVRACYASLFISCCCFTFDPIKFTFLYKFIFLFLRCIWANANYFHVHKNTSAHRLHVI